jgi:hygromycin-B 7''-O-kinase
MGPAHIVQILRDLGLAESPIERAESESNEVWMTPTHVVRYHGLGPPGRLEHESRVAERLPPEALHPRVVASGWTDGHDWTVQERAPGQALSTAWPAMGPDERKQAIAQLGDALRFVHGVAPDGLVPPFAFGGMPVIARADVVPETLRLLREGDGDRQVLDRATAIAERTARFVDDPADALIHGDLNLNNVVWNGRVTALLDFEWARADARDVDVLSFLSFCRHAVLCVPESVEALTKDDDYVDAPAWLREAYPELFSAGHLHERVTFYEIARWAQDLHRPTASSRALAHRMLADVVNGFGASEALMP